MEIRALHFDVFGTVVDWRESIAREAAKLLSSKGVDCDWHAFADAWRSRYQPAMEEVRSGRRGWAKLDDLHRENLDAVLDEFRISRVDDTDLDHLNMAWHRLDPWPDAVAGMNRLKRNYILVTLSNGNVSLMVDMAKRAGLPWDAVLGAEVVGAYKPQPEAYLRNAELLGLKPEECLMVAAHNGDLDAAGTLAYRTAFVFRRTEHGPNQSTDLEPTGDYDFVAEDFLDLADKLGC
ncbi:MAG: haloacid dehalogenase type II [Alphaproteobacteria bacterium]|nr:haloacid dehalogenase type II [Alphaproteobacteria bacterium]